MLGFDIVEVSSGFVSLPMDDLGRLTEQVEVRGLEPAPGGASAVEALASEGQRAPRLAIEEARRHLAAGAALIMVESGGITEQVRQWRTDVVAAFVGALGLERLMFEAAEPSVFSWYVKGFGPEVNLLVDHSQLIQLECPRYPRNALLSEEDVIHGVPAWSESCNKGGSPHGGAAAGCAGAGDGLRDRARAEWGWRGARREWSPLRAVGDGAGRALRLHPATRVRASAGGY